MQFEFATAGRIIFGEGALDQAGHLAAEKGRRALVVVGVSGDLPVRLLEGLQAAGLETVEFRVSSEPTTDLVRECVQLGREKQCDLVVGFGGGSAIDTGKAAAAMLSNPGDLMDYLEVVGRGQKISQRPAPCLAIPTTAGTGAEVTRNAVLGVPEKQVKVSLRSPLMVPEAALIDPELTYSLPPSVTASTGLDALTQVIEPYVSHRANPLTDAICREGIRRAAGALRRAYEDGSDREARRDMALASLMGGLALANAKLGAVHGFAGVIGGMTPGPHGAICARLLPAVMETNVRALQEREADNPALVRYDEVGRLLTCDPKAGAQEAVKWVRDLFQDLDVPPLSAYGLAMVDYPAVIEQAKRASSMQGNPIRLTEAELEEILRRADS